MDITDQKRIEAAVVTNPQSDISSVSFEVEQHHSYVVFEAPKAPATIRGAVDLDVPPDGASYSVIAPAAWPTQPSSLQRSTLPRAYRPRSCRLKASTTPTVIRSRRHMPSMTSWSMPRRSGSSNHAMCCCSATARSTIEASWESVPRHRAADGPDARRPLASDVLLGDLDDDGHADVAIGRIPAQTADDAMAAFEALQRYDELEFADFGLSALMISGVNPGASSPMRSTAC